MVDSIIFAIVLLSMLIFELTKKRSFLVTQELFPKKEDEPSIYYLSVFAKILVLIIVVVRTIQEYVLI